jgi:glutaredoxin-related protein
MSINLLDFNTIFFLHIPKTGGNSIYAHLTEIFPEKNHYKTIHNEDFLDNYSNIIQSNLVAGHQFYPFVSILKRPVFIFTFLRNPCERVISAYEYILRNSQNPYHTELVRSGYNIKEFIRDKKLWYHAQNMQTRMLGLEYDYLKIINQISENKISIQTAKKKIRTALEQPCTNKTLKLAIERLDNLDFYGITEYFNESVNLFYSLIGIDNYSSPAIIKLNAAPNIDVEEREKKYSKDDFEVIKSLNTYDIELYNYAREKFLTIKKEKILI